MSAPQNHALWSGPTPERAAVHRVLPSASIAGCCRSKASTPRTPSRTSSTSTCGSESSQGEYSNANAFHADEYTSGRREPAQHGTRHFQRSEDTTIIQTNRQTAFAEGKDEERYTRGSSRGRILARKKILQPTACSIKWPETTTDDVPLLPRVMTGNGCSDPGSITKSKAPTPSEYSDIKTSGPQVPFITSFKAHQDPPALACAQGQRYHLLPTSVSSTLNANASLGLPYIFLRRLASVIDHRTYLALRLTSRAWHTGITQVRPIKLPAIFHMPTEIIQEVYGYLDPKDFNSARHSCRAWMRASLNARLLEEMLHKGGWWASAEARMTTLIEEHGCMPPVSRIIWSLHSQLARECALAAKWTGCGVQGRRKRETFSTSELIKDLGSSDDLLNLIENPTQEASYSETNPSPFAIISITDFSDFGGLRPVKRRRSACPVHETTYEHHVHFTASACGRFLLICDAHRIFAHELSENGKVRLVNSISCPGNVRSVSMDASSGRCAIAALLCDRIGLVTNIDPRTNSNTHQGEDPTTWLLSTTRKPEHCRVYWRLGTVEDPPTSVAISPQGSYVAFGCGTGIEVHWIDPVTHQDSSRWFPLTAPSEHLYFLPSRGEPNGPDNVRLVSSAAIRSLNVECGEPRDRCSTDRQSGTTVWSSGYLFGRWISLARSGYDTYRAVPLADGLYVLFTNPETRYLCLGVDTVADVVSERLCRVIFRGPDCVPSVYAASRDVKSGLRIVAGYGDEIWLFSVPSDVFLCDDAGTDHHWTTTYCSSPVSQRVNSRVTRDNSTNAKLTRIASTPSLKAASNFPTRAQSTKEKRSVWPLVLDGQYIATVPRLTDLTISGCSQNFTIWAFSAAGPVTAWQIRGVPPEVLHYRVGRCGNVNAVPIPVTYDCPWYYSGCHRNSGSRHATCGSSTRDDEYVSSERRDYSSPCGNDAEAYQQTATSGVNIGASKHSLANCGCCLYAESCGDGGNEVFPEFEYDEEGDVVMQDAPGQEDDHNRIALDGAVGEVASEIGTCLPGVTKPTERSRSTITRCSFQSTINDGTTQHPAPFDSPEVDAPLCVIRDAGGAICRGWLADEVTTPGLTQHATKAGSWMEWQWRVEDPGTSFDALND